MEELIKFDFPTSISSIIKVVGVGGGGGNAVTKMYNESIMDVSFVLCNTDSQAMMRSPIPTKVQLGPGLGAGGNPEEARKHAERNIDDIKRMFSDETEMVFITAGMGGGTGTGASPVVARVAKEMGLLTIGIVTIPFMFEETFKILQALKGVEEIKKNVDALLVINNQLLIDKFSDLSLTDAFKKADDTLTIAVRSISEIITLPGYINLDFADVKTILKDGGVAVMSNGFGRGDNRVSDAIEDALNSPLLNNNNVSKAKKILFNISFSNTAPLMVGELKEIQNYMSNFDSRIEVIWGTALDETLEDQIKIAILASGFGIENVVSITKEVKEAKQELDENEKLQKIAEKQQEQAEIDKRRKEELAIIEEFYGIEAARQIGQPATPSPFIFTLNNIDDNETIETLINNPAYNRNERELLEIARKGIERRKENKENKENVEEKKRENEENLDV